ncbi:BTA121 domain-containing protein surface lipoprotein [Borrelia turicatae]|nr:hypothetical protein [Borrelia turicatae]UPA15423.1 hypothetical protein btBTE5EL_001103 [Borrelia turicatae]
MNKKNAIGEYHNINFPINRTFCSVNDHNNVRFDELFSQFDLTDYQISVILYLKSVLTDSEFVVRDTDGVMVKTYDNHDFYKLLSTIFGALKTKTVAGNIAATFNAKVAAEVAVAKVRKGVEKNALSERFVKINNDYREMLKLACDDPKQAYTKLIDSHFTKLNMDANIKFKAIEYDSALIVKIFDKFNLTTEEKRAVYYLRDVIIDSKFIVFYYVGHEPKYSLKTYTSNDFHYLISKIVFGTNKFKMVTNNVMGTLKAQDEALAAINMINDISEKDRLNANYLKIDNDYKEALKLAFYDPDKVCAEIIAMNYANKFEEIKIEACVRDKS